MIETSRLILRPWTEADIAPFMRATNTPAVMEYLGGVATHLNPFEHLRLAGIAFAPGILAQPPADFDFSGDGTDTAGLEAAKTQRRWSGWACAAASIWISIIPALRRVIRSGRTSPTRPSGRETDQVSLVARSKIFASSLGL